MGEGAPRVVTRKKDEIDAALKVVETLHSSGAMSDGSWAKCVVSLAYEYTMIEEDQMALVLLARPPVEYYQTVQPQQMEADDQYRDLVILLAYKLIQMGVVEGADDVHTPTMAPANA